MLAAPPAIFLHLETLGIVALVLLNGVIATLALGARESNQCPHKSSSNMTRWETIPKHLLVCQLKMAKSIKVPMRPTKKCPNEMPFLNMYSPETRQQKKDPTP